MKTKNPAAVALGKLSHQKNPRSKEQQSEAGKKGMAIRWAKYRAEKEKLSPTPLAE